MTVKEALEKLTNYQHRLSVWEAVHDWMDDEFISKDGRPAKKALLAQDCLVELVPQDVLEEILQSIGDGPIKQLREEVERLNNQNLPEVSK